MTAFVRSGERYDAIVIGGSIGGLVAAAYLARARARVLVVEARDVLGGRAETADLGAGFRAPLMAHAFHALDPRIISELHLRRRGLKFAERDMKQFALRPGGRHLVLPRHIGWMPSAVTPFAPDETQDYIRFKREIMALARRMRSWWNPGFEVAGGEEMSIAAIARRLQLSEHDGNTLEMFSRTSASAYLDRWFESDALKAGLSFDTAMDGMAPQEPGSALLMLWRHAQESCGRQAAVSQVLGGPTGLVEALERAAKRAGAEFRTGVAVASVAVEHGRAAGVTLVNGETVRAAAVLSSLDARRTLLELTPPSAIGFGAAASIPRPRGVAPAKLVLALNGAPPFAGLEPRDLRGRLIVAERPESAAEAIGVALSGQLPDEFVMEVTVPTAADATLAPSGSHVVSVMFPDMPVSVEGGWENAREVLRERAVAVLETYAPGLGDRIVAHRVLSPTDIARRYGGSLGGGAAPLPRLLSSYRARIRTPLPGLFLCGSSAEPVDAISGRAGRLAASQVFDERRHAKAGVA